AARVRLWRDGRRRALPASHGGGYFRWRRVFRRGLLCLPRRCGPGLARATDGLVLPIRAGGGGLARAAGDSGALQRTAGRDQPALHQEPFSDAREEYLGGFVSAAADSGDGARPADFRILPALQAEIAFGAEPVLDETRGDPGQTNMDPGASQSEGRRTGALV